MQHRVVVLGAGFGGLFAARRLSARADAGVDVEIIDDNNYFVFQPLLPEVAAGSVNPTDAVTPLRSMLPRAKTREARVMAIDFQRRRVEVMQGTRNTVAVVPYDHLVIALGQATDLSRFPGLTEHSFAMRDLPDAYILRNHVIDCLEQADITDDIDFKRRLLTFVVVGGGLSGVETLGEVETLISGVLRFYPRIDRREVRLLLVEFMPGILPEVAPPLAAYAARLLQARGVEIITGVGVKSAAAESVELADGRVINTATIIATIGAAPSELVRGLPLPKEKGRLVVDECLRVPGIPDVWALGDVALVPLGDGKFAPPTAQAAVQEATLLADNLLATLVGRDPRPLHFNNRGQLASLGGHRGVADLFGHHISGGLAWLLWRWIYLSMLPTGSTRLRVAVDWLLDRILPRNIVQIAQPNQPAVRRQRFRKGDVVYRRGEVTGPFYVVESGLFRRSGSDMDGVIGPGGHFGEGVLQGERLRRSAVIAEEDGFCLVIRAEDLERLASCASAFPFGPVNARPPLERKA